MTCPKCNRVIRNTEVMDVYSIPVHTLYKCYCGYSEIKWTDHYTEQGYILPYILKSMPEDDDSSCL